MTGNLILLLLTIDGWTQKGLVILHQGSIKHLKNYPAWQFNLLILLWMLRKFKGFSWWVFIFFLWYPLEKRREFSHVLYKGQFSVGGAESHACSDWCHHTHETHNMLLLSGLATCTVPCKPLTFAFPSGPVFSKQNLQCHGYQQKGLGTFEPFASVLGDFISL